MNNRSVRLQLLQYLHEYADVGNGKIIKRGRKIKTTSDILKDLQNFCSLIKKEGISLRKDLQEKITLLQKDTDKKTLEKIRNDLEEYSNANEETILMRLIGMFEEFEQEKEKEKKKEILVQIEDFVYSVTGSEDAEISWDLFAFLKECFFIYYNHNEEKAEIEYGSGGIQDREIEDSIHEKLVFLKEVLGE